MKRQLVGVSLLAIFLTGCSTLPKKLSVKLNPELSVSDNQAIINSIVSKSVYGSNSCIYKNLNYTSSGTMLMGGDYRWDGYDELKICYVPKGDEINIQNFGICQYMMNAPEGRWLYNAECSAGRYINRTDFYEQMLNVNKEIESQYPLLAQNLLKNKPIVETKTQLQNYVKEKMLSLKNAFNIFCSEYNLDRQTLASHSNPPPLMMSEYSHFINDASITADNYTDVSITVKKQIDKQFDLDLKKYQETLLKYYGYPQKPTYVKPVTVILLDGSGSMNDPDKQGDIKIISARKIIAKRIGQLDKTKTTLGMVAFNNGCGSTATYVNLNNSDFSKISNEVKELQPNGQTPLAEAIHKVFEMVKDIHQNINLIIISDGMETCGGDPIYEARQLVQLPNIKTTIHVIGYDVDEPTRLQLQNIANIGQGTYNDVHTAIAFDTAMKTISVATKLHDEKFSDDGLTYTFHINFPTDSDEIDENSMSDVIALASYIKTNNIKTRIEGYTDNTSTKEYNLALSKSRADSVVRKLIKLGVDPKLLTSTGYGQNKPIGDNSTDQGKFMNRRVEAHFIQ